MIMYGYISIETVVFAHKKYRFMSEQCRNKEKKVASPKVLIIGNMCG